MQSPKNLPSDCRAETLFPCASFCARGFETVVYLIESRVIHEVSYIHSNSSFEAWIRFFLWIGDIFFSQPTWSQTREPGPYPSHTQSVKYGESGVGSCRLSAEFWKAVRILSSSNGGKPLHVSICAARHDMGLRSVMASGIATSTWLASEWRVHLLYIPGTGAWVFKESPAPALFSPRMATARR